MLKREYNIGILCVWGTEGDGIDLERCIEKWIKVEDVLH